MARKSVEANQIRAIYGLRARGHTIDEITANLEATFGQSRSPERSTVGKYVGRYEKLSAEQKQALQPVVWERIEDYGIPWAALPTLLSIWAVRLNVIPTVAQTRWWWKLAQAAPDAPHYWIRTKAEFIEALEWTAGQLGLELNMRPLWYEIALKMWPDPSLSEDEQREAVTKATQALEEGAKKLGLDYGDEFYFPNADGHDAALSGEIAMEHLKAQEVTPTGRTILEVEEALAESRKRESQDTSSKSQRREKKGQ